MQPSRHLRVNDYFDRIFVINLRQNLQKWHIMADMLARYGLCGSVLKASMALKKSKCRPGENMQTMAWCILLSTFCNVNSSNLRVRGEHYYRVNIL